MPFVSVIVPVYKVENYIRRCIDSILNQTFQDFELILVDDGSPDLCPSICDEYARKDKRISVIHKVNAGLGAARNTGIENATGDFLCFVDSDDWIVSDTLEHMHTLVSEYDADIVSTSYCLTTGDSAVIDIHPTIKVFDSEQALLFYMKAGMRKRISEYSVWSKLYRARLFEGVRFPEGQLYEDMFTNVLLIKKASVYVKSSKICYNYFQNGLSIVRSGFKMKNHNDLLLVCNQFEELMKKESPELQKLAKEKKARTYFSSLSKIAFYGIDSSVEKPKQLKKKFLARLRKDYWLLLGSDMPANRKILMTIYVICFPIAEQMFKAYRRCRLK